MLFHMFQHMFQFQIHMHNKFWLAHIILFQHQLANTLINSKFQDIRFLRASVESGPILILRAHTLIFKKFPNLPKKLLLDFRALALKVEHLGRPHKNPKKQFPRASVKT